MNGDMVDRLLAESVHLTQVGDPMTAALRWAILVEDVLGIVLSDEQITTCHLMDPERLRSFLATMPPPA